jgi:hypothetical protein
MSHLVTVDGTKAIHIYPINELNDEGEHYEAGITMPAHRASVLGIGQLSTPNYLRADFFTWSCKGGVKFWTTQGECRDTRRVTLEQLPGGDDDTPNELKILRATSNMELFVSGDKLGVLRYL